MGNKPTTTNTSVYGENKEGITLLWFDSHIGSQDDTQQTKQQLCLINNYVKFHTDLEQCIAFIQSIDQEKIFLITSGSNASELLPHVSSFRQIDSIFIFCMNKSKYEHLMNEYAKVTGIYIDLNELCQSMQEQIDLVDKQLQTFSSFDQHQESAEFLSFQLFNDVIVRLPRNRQAKQQMIDVCRQYYRENPNELRLIEQFQQEYRSEEALRWYSKQSFVCRLLNKALRTADIELLYIFHFFISDLTEALRQEHEKMLLSTEEILTVYRGVKLDREEFDKLKENQGKLISTTGYLSTSRVRERALAFTMKPTKRTDVVSVFFQIECNVKLIGTSIHFADIAQFSEYPGEQEVLFDLNTCFRIDSIEQTGSLQLIRMSVSKEGEIITKDYIESIQKEAEEKSVAIVFGELMYSSGQYDKSQKYFEELLQDPYQEDIAWVEFNIGRALVGKGEWKEARRCYDRAYDRMINAKPARIKDSAQVLKNIGDILFDQKKDDEALDYYQRAVKIREEYYPSDNVGIAQSLNNIGLILYRQGKDNEALHYHRRVLKIREKTCPLRHVDIASSLNNIGNILSDQGKSGEALKYYQRSLKIQEEYYSSGHIDITYTLNNIGNILYNQRKYDNALDYHQRTLKMREIYYPCGHIDIGESLNNIGLCYENQNKTKMALDYYQRALTIYKTSLHANHPRCVRAERNISRMTGKN